MNKLYYPTDLFLPIGNTLCNKLAPISCDMGALSTFVTKKTLIPSQIECGCSKIELFTYKNITASLTRF